MNARTQSFVLLLFGIVLLRLGTSDLLLRFVKPSSRPWVLVAGAVIVILGLWSLLASNRRNDPSSAEPGTDSGAIDDHGHGSASRAAWLVIAPVVAILVIGPPALGQYTANRRDTVAEADPGTAFSTLPSGTKVVSMRVFDFALRALGDGRRTLAGRTVALTGFVARRDARGFTLARLIITCCAADASPVFVTVRTAAPAPALNSWVRVIGSYAGQDPSQTDVPTLKAEQVRPVSAPVEPYD